MIRVSLRFFASRVLKTKRMDAGDRETLQRVIFSDGVRSRAEAQARKRPAGAGRFACVIHRSVRYRWRNTRTP